MNKIVNGEEANHLCQVSCRSLPITYSADYIIAKKPFLHVDRVTEFHVMIYLKYGKMYIVEDGIQYVLTPGTVFFLKEGVHHWGEQPCDPDTAWYYIHFKTKISAEEQLLNHEECSMIKTNNMEDKDYQRYYELPKIIHLPFDNAIEKSLLEFIEYFRTVNLGKIVKINTMLANILIQCYEKIENRKDYVRKNRHIAHMIQYLENNYQKPFSLEQIGAEVGLNHKYVSELFKKETGQSIRDYNMQLKIRKAEHLLFETDMSISEIGEYLGFSDPFYFSNVFKKYHKVSPLKFRTDAVPPI
ncbi:MAG TPA: AraC family transcriptional regulator [Lachnospiraceae bacterium]|nr:AraC family transcriptional regulator [Lachnospiraceae bacterium]